jgi:hypothetical protein
MARISAADMQIVEEALGSGSGYVADFTNGTFNSFFQREVGVPIYSDEYAGHGTSKGKRLRAFLEEGSDDDALRALRGLRDYVAGTGWKVDWRSTEEWTPIWAAFVDLIKRLEGPAKNGLGDQEVMPWLAKVQKKLREIQQLAFKAYDDAIDAEKREIGEGVKTALETHYAILKDLLPVDFPASKMGEIARHIRFCEFADMRSIVGWDVPDVMAKAERYAVDVQAADDEEDDEHNILAYVDEIFRQAVLDTMDARNPDWHMLVLKCCLILAERFTGMTGMEDDLSSYGRAFSLKGPKLLVPPDLSTETHRSQQQGAMFLFQGYRAFLRNTHAHQLKEGDETFALQAVVFLSILADVLSAAMIAEDSGMIHAGGK